MAPPSEPSLLQTILAYQIVSEIVGLLKLLLKGLLMSAPVTAHYKRIWAQSLKSRELIIQWLLLGVFFFFALIAFTTSNSTITVRNDMAAPLPWPPPLTKTEVDSWATALKDHRKVTEVMVVWGESLQSPFVASMAQAMANAGWPEPSLIPGGFMVGVHVVASKDSWDVGKHLQGLLEAKLGPIRLDPVTADKKTGVFPNGRIAVYVGLQPVGWEPK
jgi:hypothetical protein